MKKWYLISIAILFLAFNSCKKDDTQGVTATKMKLADNLAKLGIPEVMKNSSNSNAQQAVGYYDQVMGIENDFTWFNLPSDATHDGDNYYWSYGGLSLWEVYSESGSNYDWDIYVKTTETSKQKYFHSEESKDGKTGKMEIYNYASATDDELLSYQWTFDSKGNMTMTESSGDGSFEYEIVSNIDLSGSSKMYSDGKLFYSFQWNSDGSGSYVYYNDDGTVALTQTWAVSDL